MKSLRDQLNEGRPRHQTKLFLVVVTALFLASTLFFHHKSSPHAPAQHRPMHAEHLLSHCRARNIVPGPPSNFKSRTESDRFQPGTPATYIKNATIWIGRSEGTYENGDILIDK